MTQRDVEKKRGEVAVLVVKRDVEVIIFTVIDDYLLVFLHAREIVMSFIYNYDLANYFPCKKRDTRKRYSANLDN